MTQQPMLLNVGNYVFERQIGRGATARVWLGRHRSLGTRQYAIKVSHTLADHETQLLQREAQIMSRLTHPAVPHIYDHGITPTFHYIVMDYAPGVSLRHLLKAHRTLSVAQTITIAKAVAQVIDEIHAHGVIHRDINPNNILVDNSDDTMRVTLIDFGIARDMTQATVTLPVSELGTMPYTAPEQRADPNDALYLSDIYSFGVMVFEMLSGNLPWDDEHTTPVPTLAQRGAVGIPAEIDDVIAKLLAPAALERYRSASDAVNDMQRIIDKHTAQTTITVATEPVVISHTAHPVEVVLAVELKHHIINESFEFAQQTGTPEVISSLLDTWGTQRFYRRKLLGRLANITSINNRTLFHYRLACVIESRNAPYTVMTAQPLADESVMDEPFSGDRWGLPIPAHQPNGSDSSGTIIVPGSQISITCPHCHEGRRTCPSCHNHPIESSDNAPAAPCATCGGIGTIPCPECRGSGQCYQHHVMPWRRMHHTHVTHDDHTHIPQAWFQSQCTPRPVYHHQELNGIRPEWKRIPKVAQLIEEITAKLTPDSRIVWCELHISVVPLSEFVFDIGNDLPWGHTQPAPQYRWEVYGFERILSPNRKLLDWRLLALIVLSGLCFILISVIIMLTM